MSTLRQIFSGAAWVIAARWSVRGLGLVSTLILARLLTPADFGIVAMAMFLVGVIEAFGETGLTVYIIRHPDPQRSHFDTAFTLKLLICVGLAAVMFLAAPYGATLFHEPRVKDVVRVLALRPLLFGLENPGIIRFRKDMIFSKEFEFQLVNKVVSFLITLTLAISLKNYWALTFGIVSGGFASTLQSYRMHPYRPRLDVSETRAMWAFSSWVLAQSLLQFFNSRIDELIVGRLKSAMMMGYYSVASDVAASPTLELIAPFSRALLPGVVKLARDPRELSDAFRKVLSSVAVVSFAAGGGIAMVADDLIQILLGQQWGSIVSLLRLLAVSAALLALVTPLHTLLNATGQARSSALLSLLRQVLLIVTMVPAAIWSDLTAVASARTAVAFITFALTTHVYSRVVGIPAAAVWEGLIRPAAATLVMGLVIGLIHLASPDQPLVRLSLSITVGGATYVTTLMLLWRLAGCPDSIETHAYDAITSLRPRTLTRHSSPTKR